MHIWSQFTEHMLPSWVHRDQCRRHLQGSFQVLRSRSSSFAMCGESGGGWIGRPDVGSPILHPTLGVLAPFPSLSCTCRIAVFDPARVCDSFDPLLVDVVLSPPPCFAEDTLGFVLPRSRFHLSIPDLPVLDGHRPTQRRGTSRIGHPPQTHTHTHPGTTPLPSGPVRTRRRRDADVSREGGMRPPPCPWDGRDWEGRNGGKEQEPRSPLRLVVGIPMEPRKIHLNVVGSRATCRFSHPSSQPSDRIPFESGPSIAIVLHFRYGVGCPSFRPIQTLVLVDGRATSILSTSILDGFRPRRCGVGFRLKRRRIHRSGPSSKLGRGVWVDSNVLAEKGV